LDQGSAEAGRHRVVAEGAWLYDGTVPQHIAIYAKPARFADTRYDDDDQLDESRPIPKTKDGFLYWEDLVNT
jgi:hypothetical protein